MLFKDAAYEYMADKRKRLGHLDPGITDHQGITSETFDDKSSESVSSHIYKSELSFEFLVLSIYK